MRKPLPISEHPPEDERALPLATFPVVRVPFPFRDQRAERRRPAILISAPAFQKGSAHLLLAMVTTARHFSWPLDWPIQDLPPAGLRRPCLIRLKLFTLDERLILGQLVHLGEEDRLGVQNNLRTLIVL